MRTWFPRARTVNAETHLRSHTLLVGRIIRSIDDFLREEDIPLINYTLEKQGDNLYISSVDGENVDRLTPLESNLLKHLNTNGFDLRDVVIEKKIED